MIDVTRRRLLASASAVLAAPVVLAQSGFDHQHGAWTALLKKHVVPIRGGQASQVNYTTFAANRDALRTYLESLSAVSDAAFQAFNQSQQQAFLLNAYNAFTVELILGKYPQLQSIRDLGGLLSSPWKVKWIQLLGAKVSLDFIENDVLRKRGRYDDPRIHFALNCASIGCPALRDEAYAASRLTAQLDEQTLLFLSDRSRNRYNPQRQRVEVSKIFDWYADDFRAGHRGIASLEAFLGRYADQLADAVADRERIRAGRMDIAFLDYDWKLNDARG